MILSPKEASARTREICAMAPIVPVLVVHDAGKARALAEALVAGGLPALEVTLRTPAALAAISAMAEVSGGHVGAGTLITPEDVRAAKAAGATFGVSPGQQTSFSPPARPRACRFCPGLPRPARRCGFWRGAMTCSSFSRPKLRAVRLRSRRLARLCPRSAFAPQGA